VYIKIVSLLFTQKMAQLMRKPIEGGDWACLGRSFSLGSGWLNTPWMSLIEEMIKNRAQFCHSQLNPLNNFDIPKTNPRLKLLQSRRPSWRFGVGPSSSAVCCDSFRSCECLRLSAQQVCSIRWKKNDFQVPAFRL